MNIISFCYFLRSHEVKRDWIVDKIANNINPSIKSTLSLIRIDFAGSKIWQLNEATTTKKASDEWAKHVPRFLGVPFSVHARAVAQSRSLTSASHAQQLHALCTHQYTRHNIITDWRCEIMRVRLYSILNEKKKKTHTHDTHQHEVNSERRPNSCAVIIRFINVAE